MIGGFGSSLRYNDKVIRGRFMIVAHLPKGIAYTSADSCSLAFSACAVAKAAVCIGQFAADRGLNDRGLWLL